MKYIIAILAFFHFISPLQPVGVVTVPPVDSISPSVKIDWYYPLTEYSQRGSLKKFGQYFSASSYIGKNTIFPNHFTGYHAGSDMEILPGEETVQVPVFAIGSGKIIFVGNVEGYGGVILEKLSLENLTVLYGHINYQSSLVSPGAGVSAGQQLVFLGKAYSAETGGERKHLHLGIYKIDGNYFKGYESSLTGLNSHWVDPVKFLSDRNAHD